MKNQDVRRESKAAELLLRPIAEGLETTDSSFSHKLRPAFSAQEKAKIRARIAERTANEGRR